MGWPKKGCYKTNGHKFYNSLEQKVFVSNHIVFMDKEFLLEDSGSKVELGEVQSAQIDADHLTGPKADIRSDEEIVDPFEGQALCRKSRTHTVPKRYGFLISEHNDVFLIEYDEPTTYEESLNSLEYEKWNIAMKLEMGSMYTNQVWTLVDPPKGLKPIWCKWIFKKKTNK